MGRIMLFFSSHIRNMKPEVSYISIAIISIYTMNSTFHSGCWEGSWNIKKKFMKNIL